LTKSALAQGLVGAVGVAASDEQGRGQQAAQLAAFVAQMVGLKYGRNDELESDALGVGLMSDAGYDPRAMVAVMTILAKSSGGSRQPEFLSSHPDPGNRQEKIQEAIAARFPGGVPSDLKLGRKITLGADAVSSN
jgi:predicted Zn-dependent protease